MWEVEAQVAYYLGMAVRLVWICFAAYYSWRSFWEYRANRVASLHPASSGDGKTIVRRYRHRRSRGMFAGFLMAFVAGVVGWVTFLSYTPRIETNIANIAVSLTVTAMLVAFSRAKEADLHMREDALEYRKQHPPERMTDCNVGREIAEGPEGKEE